jgi:hypothetical protein
MDRTHRDQRIGAALEQIQQRREAAERAAAEQAETTRVYDQAVAQGATRCGAPPRGADRVAVAKARWDREYAKAQARYAEFLARPRRPGRMVDPDEHHRVRAARTAYEATLTRAEQQTAPSAGEPAASAAPGQDLTANLTDPDSRLLKTRGGWIQGYNCQTAASEDEFLVSARATQDANDLEQFVPTTDDVTATAGHLAERTGRTDLEVGTMVGDAGYDSDTNLTAEGPDRLIADAKRHVIDRRAATDPATGDPPEDATAREKMNHRLRTEEGLTLYKRRAPMAETPNAWLKDRRGLRRFARRGLAAVQAELSLACAVTNLLKLRTKGVTTTRLRTA